MTQHTAIPSDAEYLAGAHMKSWNTVAEHAKQNIVQLWKHEFDRPNMRAMIDKYGCIYAFDFETERWKSVQFVDSWISQQFLPHVRKDGLDHVRKQVEQYMRVNLVKRYAESKWTKSEKTGNWECLSSCENEFVMHERASGNGRLSQLVGYLDEFTNVGPFPKLDPELVAYTCGVLHQERYDGAFKTWPARLPTGEFYDRRVLDELCTIDFDPFLSLSILQLIAQYCDKFDSALRYGGAYIVMPCDRKHKGCLKR